MARKNKWKETREARKSFEMAREINKLSKTAKRNTKALREHGFSRMLKHRYMYKGVFVDELSSDIVGQLASDHLTILDPVEVRLLEEKWIPTWVNTIVSLFHNRRAVSAAHLYELHNHFSEVTRDLYKEWLIRGNTTAFNSLLEFYILQIECKDAL